MNRRFFVESPILPENPVQLVGQEAQHLGRVLRAKPGDQVVLFDGSGVEFDGEVISVSRSEVELRIVERRDVDREPQHRIALAVAMPKGDRQRWLVEKSVELGVAQLIPLITHRGVAQPTSSALKRLQRAVVEASKQCGRNRLMEIAEPLKLPQLLELKAGARLIAHPTAKLFDFGDACKTSSITAIGPEGGFTDEEIEAALGAEWTPVSLGSRILRVETAALALAAKLA